MRLGGRRRRSRWSGCGSYWLLLGIECHPIVAHIVPRTVLDWYCEEVEAITYLWEAIGMCSNDSNISRLRVEVV